MTASNPRADAPVSTETEMVSDRKQMAGKLVTHPTHPRTLRVWGPRSSIYDYLLRSTPEGEGMMSASHLTRWDVTISAETKIVSDCEGKTESGEDSPHPSEDRVLPTVSTRLERR